MRPATIILIATAALAAPRPPPTPPSAIHISPETPCNVERRDVSQDAPDLENEKPVVETSDTIETPDTTEDEPSQADQAKQLEACVWFGAPVGDTRDHWSINHCLRRPSPMCVIL